MNTTALAHFFCTQGLFNNRNCPLRTQTQIPHNHVVKHHNCKKKRNHGYVFLPSDGTKSTCPLLTHNVHATISTLKHPIDNKTQPRVGFLHGFTALPAKMPTNTKHATRVRKTANCNCCMAHALRTAKKQKNSKKEVHFKWTSCCFVVTK